MMLIAKIHCRALFSNSSAAFGSKQQVFLLVIYFAAAFKKRLKMSPCDWQYLADGLSTNWNHARNKFRKAIAHSKSFFIVFVNFWWDLIKFYFTYFILIWTVQSFPFLTNNKFNGLRGQPRIRSTQNVLFSIDLSLVLSSLIARSFSHSLKKRIKQKPNKRSIDTEKRA